MDPRHTIQPPENASTLSHRAERIKVYVRRHLRDDLHEVTIAKKLGFSPSTIQHFFKKETGESLRQYVERKRMHRALKLLERGKWVKEVMASTGYKNRGTFNRIFRKWYGRTPGSLYR